MAKRKLRIVKHDSDGALMGAYLYCSKTFEAPPDARGLARQIDIAKQFDAHKCHTLDSSQNALRIVREATEGT